MTAASPNEPGSASVAPAEKRVPGPRFRELDGLRGIAALAVVFSHFGGTHNFHYRDDPPAFHDFVWGGTGVQLFFMISGFVILMTARRASRPSDFVISRAARLYPPYWLSLAFAVVILALVQVPGYSLSPGQIIVNLTMVQRWLLVDDVVDVYWTLAVEMQFYALVLTLLILSRCRLSDRLVLWACLGWSVLSWTVVAVTSQAAAPRPAGDPTWVKLANNITVAEYAPMFVLGMVVFLARETGRHRKAVAAAFASAVVSPFVLRDMTLGFWVLAAATLFTVAALRRKTWLLTTPPFQFYGKISYSLYIVHVIPGYLIIHAVWPMVGRDSAMLVALAVVTVLARILQAVGEDRLGKSAKRGLTSLRVRVDAVTGRGPMRAAPGAALEGSHALRGRPGSGTTPSEDGQTG